MTSKLEEAPSLANAKAFGAFYTDAQIADFLVAWAVRQRSDLVLDPSFGGGVFLRAAAKRVTALKGNASNQIFGVELDPGVRRKIGVKLGEEFGVPLTSLLHADFFSVEPSSWRKVDAVVGNPPFIRYQTFSGASRSLGITQAKRAGVILSELCSAWAPFVIHSASMLKVGGRLAMVLPVELLHATYAKPVLRFLISNFRRVTILTFRSPLFPDLSENTLLVLAEDRGHHEKPELLHRDFEHAGMLRDVLKPSSSRISGVQRVHQEDIASGSKRLTEYLLPKKTRELYGELCNSTMTHRLGDIADVGIGYVSGANEFFHLDRSQVREWNIPKKYLKPAIRRGRGLLGLELTAADWQSNLEIGEACFLFHIKEANPSSESVLNYIEHGKKRGFNKGYKCSNRTPWYSVPHVYDADAFLSYMSTRSPRLVVNDASAVAPNSLHVLRFNEPQHGLSLGVSWQTSLVRLSCELEGHALGGGMLKLEPREAGNVRVPVVSKLGFNGIAKDVDGLLRNNRPDTASAIADEHVLRRRLNLSVRDCRLLREAVATLQERRV